ncbi:MAG: PEP-CTERM sorting domain-containing protein [Verrucomicrobia bacterium]|nr:PEP-CTERM sorting domain-containing protein [Verrucomicrobiota bacterium]
MLARHDLRLLSGVLLLLLLSTPARAQTTYTSILDVSSFGWLDQFSLNTLEYNFVGAEACVPTSSVNTMTYLQNSFSSYFGTNLTGSSDADWINVDATLISPDYMNTGPKGATNEATAYNHLHFGLNKYVVQNQHFPGVQFSGMIPSLGWDIPARPAPEPRPAAIADSFPTWQFLYDSLISGSGTVLGLTYTSLKAGHAVSLGGFDWTDLNGNGRIDFDENAQLHFVDPLDPTRGTDPDPIGAAKFTTGRIWEVEIPDPTNSAVVYNTLELAYSQYQGTDLWGGLSGGVGSDYGLASAYLTTAVAMTVPEPSTYALLAISAAGLVGFVLRRRRP